MGALLRMLRVWAQQYLFAQRYGLAFDNVVAAKCRKWREAFEAPRHHRELGLADHALAGDRSGYDTSATIVQRLEIAHDSIIASVFEQAAFGRRGNDRMRGLLRREQRRQRRRHVPIIGVLPKFDRQPGQRRTGPHERCEYIGAEEGAIGLHIKHVDDDRPSQEIGMSVFKEDQRVDAVASRTARDVEEVQRGAGARGKRFDQRPGKEFGDLLHAQPEQDEVRPGRERPVARTGKAAGEVLDADLEDVGAEAVEKSAIGGEHGRVHGGAQRRALRGELQEHAIKLRRRKALLALPRVEALVELTHARRIVRDGETGIAEIDHRQAAPIGRLRVDQIAVRLVRGALHRPQRGTATPDNPAANRAKSAGPGCEAGARSE